MWLVYNKNGTLIKQIDNGTAKRAGVLGGTFEIYALFQDLDTLTNTPADADITFRGPDGEPTIPFDMDLEEVEFVKEETDGDTLPLINGEKYKVYKYIVNSTDLFKYQGVYHATIKLYQGNPPAILVSGRVDFFIEDSVDYFDDGSIDATIYEQLKMAINKKLMLRASIWKMVKVFFLCNKNTTEKTLLMLI